MGTMVIRAMSVCIAADSLADGVVSVARLTRIVSDIFNDDPIESSAAADSLTEAMLASALVTCVSFADGIAQRATSARIVSDNLTEGMIKVATFARIVGTSDSFENRVREVSVTLDNLLDTLTANGVKGSSAFETIVRPCLPEAR